MKKQKKKELTFEEWCDPERQTSRLAEKVSKFMDSEFQLAPTYTTHVEIDEKTNSYVISITIPKGHGKNGPTYNVLDEKV